MRLSQIGDEFVRWLLKEDRGPLEPLDFEIIQKEHPFLAGFIEKLAVAQAKEFAGKHKGPPFIPFTHLPGFLAASMRHILVVLDCEDDWEAERILRRTDDRGG